MARRNRLHNEWFRTVSLGGRKSCPCCKAKLQEGEHIWSWGEYLHGKWRTVKHFCKECFVEEVREPLLKHQAECGCGIAVVCTGWEMQPEWLTLEVKEVAHVG